MEIFVFYYGQEFSSSTQIFVHGFKCSYSLSQLQWLYNTDHSEWYWTHRGHMHHNMDPDFRYPRVCVVGHFGSCSLHYPISVSTAFIALYGRPSALRHGSKEKGKSYQDGSRPREYTRACSPHNHDSVLDINMWLRSPKGYSIAHGELVNISEPTCRCITPTFFASWLLIILMCLFSTESIASTSV